jgi:hypothetical protein
MEWLSCHRISRDNKDEQTVEGRGGGHVFLRQANADRRRGLAGNVRSTREDFDDEIGKLSPFASPTLVRAVASNSMIPRATETWGYLATKVTCLNKGGSPWDFPYNTGFSSYNGSAPEGF